jgi:pimeloyl-ACP methyl ester carboxylesterase
MATIEKSVAGAAGRTLIPASRSVRADASVVTVAIAAQSLAFAVMLGAAGSLEWQLGRIALALALGIGALVVEVRASRAVRAWSALALGLVGLTAGTGIGIMHVVKSDLTLTAVAALVVLASGVVLGAAAAHRLWSLSRSWWRLLGIPLVFVLGEFVLIPVTVAIYATNIPATPLGTATPADRGLSYSEVSVQAGDGVRLSGWYIPSKNGAAVLALHGSGSNRTGVLDQSVVVAKHGYGVLLLDARGHGRSAGVGMDNGWWGDDDVAAAVRGLAARPDVSGGRIGLLGMSMGGEEAIGAAASNRAVKAVVAEGALWRGSMDAAWLPTDVDGYIQRAMLEVQTTVTELLTDAPRPVSLRAALAATAPRPVLLIAGQSEVRGDTYLHDHAPGNVELWTLPDTPHTGGLSHHPVQWEQRVVGFLDRNLLTATA